MSFNPELPVQTRDGRAARIICTDKHARKQIVALILNHDGSEICECYHDDGWHNNYWGPDQKNRTERLDLINIPARRWAVIWKTEGEYGVTVVADEIIADEIKKGIGFIACLPFSEGDGLD